MEKISAWLEDRLSISTVTEFASHKTVPVHRHTVFYYLGGMTLFFFLVQVATGILLMLYYRPSAEEAFESIEFLMTTVPFGWLIRSIHSWSANLMVFFAFIHLASVFFMKAYRAPRELTWISGALALFLIMGFGFSGYLLPWNQLAFFATKVGTDIAGAVPFVGEWMLRFLRGGDRVTGGTLSRFYGWHVAILPAITSVVIGGHILLVQIKGMSVPPVDEEEAAHRPPMRFFPNFALRDLFGWTLALGVLAALAALFPWELGEKADPFAPAYENIRPEWYFVWMFQGLKLVPGGEALGIEYEAMLILFFGLCGLVLVLIPFLDRGVLTRGKSPAFTIAGIIALVVVVFMTCWGYASLVPLYIVLATAALLFILRLATSPGKRGDNGADTEGTPSRAAIPMILVALTALAFAGSARAAQPKTSCLSCHSDSSMFEGEKLAIPTHYQNDIHAKNGLSCHDCHGGNPDPKLAEDMTAAMDPGFKANPYRGVPKRAEIPGFCGKCHSSPVFMNRFLPGARVDQEQEYWTSKHGQALRSGDDKVATCIDCHSVHGIRAVSDSDSPVYANHVAETCSKCHSDAKRMAGYKDAQGRPLPVDQYARWKRSVHAAAMMEKGDLTAPTCNDCHGNHGARPPGLQSVGFVCGQCHGRETDLFRASAKHEGFQRHNDLLASGATCNDCHEGLPPQITAIREFSECVTCHENHAIIRPTVAMLGTLPDTPCAFCHEGTGKIARVVSEPEENWQHYLSVRNGLLAQAANLNLQGDNRFDWLVDQAQKLSTHVQTPRGDERQPSLRPEFARLFQKFRIGKTHYTYTDPVTGKEVSQPVRQCTNCHKAVDSKGRAVASAYLAGTRELAGSTARAERILLAAERGGVEVRKARPNLDAAVDDQIELQVLVHSFNNGGQFAEKRAEGLKNAEAALMAGKESLGELSYRRGGLLVALGIIVLLLLALGAKIRMMS